MSLLCIYCAGGLGRDFLSLLKATNTGNWKKILFIDDICEEEIVNNTKIINFQDFINAKYEKKNCEFVILNGEPLYREYLFRKVLDYRFRIGKIVFNSSIVAQDTFIKSGSVIHCQSIISSGAIIEENVFIGKKAMVGHDVYVGEHSVISACSYIGGWVRIEKGCFVGAGAVIRDRVNIGKNCIVGIGSVVIKDIPDNTVVAGNPAKFLRVNEKHIVFN